MTSQPSETRSTNTISVDDFIGILKSVFGDGVEEVTGAHATPPPVPPKKQKPPPQAEMLDFETPP